jgi:hypothetical protein
MTVCTAGIAYIVSGTGCLASNTRAEAAVGVLCACCTVVWFTWLQRVG